MGHKFSEWGTWNRIVLMLLIYTAFLDVSACL